MSLTVAKVGGSLYDLPDLRGRVRNWIAGRSGPVLLVPGGGAGVDAVRQLDRIHALGEETAHWLALRVLAVNAHFLGGLLTLPVVGSPTETNWPAAVLDPHAFCLADDGRPGALPHLWQVTSDAIAARAAEVAGAGLALLKSADLPAGATWDSAAAAGLVDEVVGTVINRARLTVEWYDLRRTRFPL